MEEEAGTRRAGGEEQNRANGRGKPTITARHLSVGHRYDCSSEIHHGKYSSMGFSDTTVDTGLINASNTSPRYCFIEHTDTLFTDIFITIHLRALGYTQSITADVPCLKREGRLLSLAT